MRLKFHLDLTKFDGSYSQVMLSAIYFSNISDLKNWSESALEYNAKRIFIGRYLTTISLQDENGQTLVSFGTVTATNLSADNTYIEFEADITDSALQYEIPVLEVNDIISLDVNGKTRFMTYMQTSENNVITKTLQPVGAIYGKFNNAIGLANIEIDIVGYDLDFNYIFIPKLNRYYYVDSINFVTADLTRLFLKEDVLMSHKDLIKSQNAFVTRYEYSFNKKLIDVRYPVNDVIKVEYLTLNNTPTSQSLVNTHLQTDIDEDDFKIVVNSVSNTYQITQLREVPAPSGLSLPNLTPLMSNVEFTSFLKGNQLGYLVYALANQSDLLSFVNSAVIFPFDVSEPYSACLPDYPSEAFMLNQNLIAKDDRLCTDSAFHDVTDTSHTPVPVARTNAGASPYFIVADFTLDHKFDNYLDYAPYTNFELYIAFVGWIPLNATQVIDKRLIVYYTIDYKSGMGTAYLYNVTDQKLIWSGNSQIGIKIDLTATNQVENTRAKQSNNLNMILGLMSSALAIGVGVVTENPVAIAGGVLNAGKTIASGVQANMTMFERAQTNFGTGEGIFHAPVEIQARVSYHEPILDEDGYDKYLHLQGKPFNNYVTLSTLSTGAYVEVGDIDFNPNNAKIYQNEITEIVALLKNGVIL